MNADVWVALAGVLFAGAVQVGIFSFFLGRLFETTNALKRRVDALENRPIVDYNTRLSVVESVVDNIKESLEASEARVDTKFKEFEQTIRSMMQLRESTVRTRGSTK